MDAIVMDTSDMWLAAASISYGLIIQKVDRSDVRRVRFEFGGKLNTVYWMQNGSMMQETNPQWEWFRLRYQDRSLMYPGTYPVDLKTIKAELFKSNA